MSEKSVGDKFEEIFANCKKRIIVADATKIILFFRCFCIMNDVFRKVRINSKKTSKKCPF